VITTATALEKLVKAVNTRDRKLPTFSVRTLGDA